MMALLEPGIEEILDSEGSANYLRTMVGSHTYSANNDALILVQLPEATDVASYGTRQKLGRRVCKGEKGMIVFVPHRRRVRVSSEEDKNKPRTGEQYPQTTRTIRGFGLGRVFNIAQTEGEPLPESPAARELEGRARPEGGPTGTSPAC